MREDTHLLSTLILSKFTKSHTGFKNNSSAKNYFYNVNKLF